MLNLSITILLACIFIGLASRYLPALPLFRNLSLSSNLAPGPSLTNTISNTGTASSLFAGNEGIAISPLHPTGRAQIGQEHFDVLTEGEFIAAGTPIQILKIMDQKIIVGPRIQT
jgi:membrane-bound serine protease (ClpP class)